jgi:serine O-acetyltransferase
MTAHSRPSKEPLVNLDPIWRRIRDEAEAIAVREPEIASFVYANILNHDRFETAIAHRIAIRLDHKDVPADLIQHAFATMFEDEPGLADMMRVDIAAVLERDPACMRLVEPLLYFKGFHAIQTHRLANWLWRKGRKDFAYYLQSRSSAVFQTDIHPAVSMGRGIFLDHATGLVIGETAVIEDDVSILQEVTLGGRGTEKGDRHPKIRRGVLIGAGAKVLGNIEIGEGSWVGASSVVTKPVPPGVKVAGVPAKVVGHVGPEIPSHEMDLGLADQPDRD